MSDFLERVVRERQADVAAARAWRPFEQVKRMAQLARARSPWGRIRFADALRDRRRDGWLAVIAEVKRVSPALGPLADRLDPAGLAQRYQNAGAAAISVLTEPRHWGGSLDDLRAVVPAVHRYAAYEVVPAQAGPSLAPDAPRIVPIPVLAKDVVVDEYQVAEAGAAGAHAVLLIAEVLRDARLVRCIEVALELGLDPLVEAHDPVAFSLAVRAIAEYARDLRHDEEQLGRIMFGVNARDLREPSRIDRRRIHELASLVPEPHILVAESGITSVEDAEALPPRADAVLVGTALVSAVDPAPLIRALAEVRPARSLA